MTISRKLQYGLLVRHGQALETGFTMVDDLKKEGVRIAYQGVEGSYGHGAALQYFGQDADVYHVKSMEDAMVEVEEGRADYAVLPIENSSAGAVSDNYDLLVKHNVYIVGETELAVNHALLGLPGATLEDIRQVYSHPQALMQCSQYLKQPQTVAPGKYGKHSCFRKEGIRGCRCDPGSCSQRDRRKAVWSESAPAIH